MTLRGTSWEAVVRATDFDDVPRSGWLTVVMTNVAVVTGGARGIGRGIAATMAARGYGVVITDIDRTAVTEAAEEIGALAGLVQDVSREESHREVAEVAAGHGTLRAWFNNAGVGNDGALAELDSAVVERLVDVNLKGTIWGMRAALDAFGPGGGDVVNTASLSGLGPVPGLSTYAATKAAVVSLTMSVASEVPKGVRVHALCPDGVDTRLVAEMDDDGLAKALVHSGGRILTVDEVAEAAVALLGSRRIVRTVPGWRGGLLRTSSLAPGLTGRGVGVLAAVGNRVRRARA